MRAVGVGADRLCRDCLGLELASSRDLPDRSWGDLVGCGRKLAGGSQMWPPSHIRPHDHNCSRATRSGFGRPCVAALRLDLVSG